MNSSGRTGARAAHGHRVGVCSLSLVRDTKQYDSEESSSGRLFFYAFFGEEDQRRQEKTTGTLLSSMVMAVHIIGKATFEEDEIKFADGIQIVRMNEEYQMARQHSCKYEVVSEDWIAACATHMIILDNYAYRYGIEFHIHALLSDFRWGG
jgi:hypothetical protein